MIMSIKEEGRKRRLERETDDDQPDKKIKSEGGEIHSIFTEKMYSTYIQSALESLDKVSVILRLFTCICILTSY